MAEESIFALMNNNIKPYSEQEDKKTQIQRMFNNIAHSYDFLNHVLSLGIDRTWRKKMINALQGHPVNILLDLATGTGDVAFTAARFLPVKRIVGLDLSVNMIAIARNKLAGKIFKPPVEITFGEGDAESINFEDQSFDAITVAFGVRNFQNLQNGLAEMYRVLKPGGKAVILEFTKPRIFPFKQLYFFYFQYVLPLFGKLTSKDQRAYSYLFESVIAFPEYAQFTQIMAEQGFTKVEFRPLTLGICTIYQGSKS